MSKEAERVNRYGRNLARGYRRAAAALLTCLLLLVSLAVPAGAASPAPAADVILRVTDPSGQPLSRVNLEVYQLNHGLVTMATSGLDGTARIPLTADRRGLWFVRAWAPQYQVKETGWFDPAQGGVRTIELQPLGGEVHAYVRDGSGNRLYGSYLLMSATGRLVAQGQFTDGRVVAQVASGTYTLTVSADGYAPATQTVAVAPGRVTVATFVLRNGTLTVEGEVVDAATGAVLRGAKVELLGDSNLVLAEGETGSDGRFRLEAPNVSDTYRLRVSAPGYRSVTTEPRSAEGALNLDYFGADRVALSRPTATIEGVLTGFGGEPLADTMVILMREGLGEVAATVTNKDGRFRFADLPAGDIRYAIVADNVKRDDWHDLFLSGWVKPEPGTTLWVPVSAEPYPDLGTTQGRLSGVVLTQDGQRLSGATVELIRRTRVVATTTTDDQGNFDFDEVSATMREGMADAPYMLRISKSGYVTTRQVLVGGQSQVAFHVPEEARVTVQATLRPSSVAPKGRVIDQNGLPVYNARVELTMAGQSRPTVTRTDANGWYTLRPIPTHSSGVTVRVEADGYLPSEEVDITATLASGDRPPTFRLTRRDSTIDGVVMDLRGRPVGGAKVQLYVDGELAAEATAQDDGYYSLTADLTTATSAMLTATAFGYTDGGAVLQSLPGPGEGLTQMLVLQPKRAVVMGRVLDEQGNPVAGATVELTLEGDSALQLATTDAAGNYRLEVDLASGAAWAWLRVRPVTGVFAGSLTHGMDLAPVVRLTAGDLVVTDLLVRP
nr:MAG: hypothetical protein DIU55_10920 [Bacillota bacterium]